MTMPIYSSWAFEYNLLVGPLSVIRTGYPHEYVPVRYIHVSSCNIPSFQKSEKSEKFQTFSNYMYFALKRNFMHCMHHHLVLFAFVCSKDWNIIFQFKTYLIKLYVGIYIIPNKTF